MDYKGRFRTLTSREREVLDLFCQGYKHSQIAERLFIAPKTVRSHMVHIYEKLDLMHLTPRARAFELREKYWPLHTSEPSGRSDDAVEIVSPHPPGIEELLEEDEGVMSALVPSPPLELRTPPRPFRRTRLSCSVWPLLLLVVVSAFFYLGGWQALRGWLAAELASEATATLEATSTEALAVLLPSSTEDVQHSATPTTTFTATSTLTSTPSPLPTSTLPPTPRPTATPNFGPIYELGEWHREGNLWFRLVNYTVDWEGIYLTVEMWNRTGQTVFFQWSTNNSMMLRDNIGNRYTVDSRFDGNVDNEIVPANTQMNIGSDPYMNWTNWYDPDNLFLPGVSELYFTLDYFSVVERATWRFSPGN